MSSAAFFDIDGTLVKCLTQEKLAKVMKEEKLLTSMQIFQIYFWFLIYKLGLINNSNNLRKKTYQTFTALPKSEIDKLFLRVFESHVKPDIRFKMKERILNHKANGQIVFAISGSISNLCKPICSFFGIENLYATNLLVKEERYTGLWEGDILEGNAKVILIRKLAEKYALDLSKSTCYADSYSDLGILKEVGNPIAVYPDPKLKRYAIDNKWQIMED